MIKRLPSFELDPPRSSIVGGKVLSIVLVVSVSVEVVYVVVVVIVEEVVVEVVVVTIGLTQLQQSASD